MKNITDIFFDLDHTLWDFDSNSTLALKKIFEELKISIPINEFVAIFIPINLECWKLYQTNKMTHEELRYSRLRQSFDALNYSISDDEINDISVLYINYLPKNNHLFEGAKEVLDYLKPQYNLHIITNGVADVQVKKIANSGLEKYFKTITNSEMAGVMKPHRTIFEYALTLANTQKENAIMIGDCIIADVGGALDFGIQAILFDDKGTHIPSGFTTIKHLSELKNIL